MNRNTLLLAIETGKMLAVLGSVVPLMRGDKGEKSLARLRAGLDQMVAHAVVKREMLAMHGIEAMHAALLSALKELNTLVLLRHAAGISVMDTYSKLTQFKTNPRVTTSHEVELQLEAYMALAAAPLTVQLPGKVSQDERGRILHKFNSLVRNADWESLLIKLRIPHAPGSEDLQHRLMRHTSTNQGREQVMDKLTALTTSLASKRASASAESAEALPAGVPGAPLFQVTLQLSQDGVLAHPDVVAVLEKTPVLPAAAGQASPSLLELLAEACAPVELKEGQDPSAVAKASLADLVKKLTARKTAMKRLETAYKRKTEDAKKDKTVEALRGLDPQLLEVLKANPDLLSKA